MAKLSHKFWLWVGRKIAHHAFIETLKGDYPLNINLDDSVALTAEEIEERASLEDSIRKGYES